MSDATTTLFSTSRQGLSRRMRPSVGAVAALLMTSIFATSSGAPRAVAEEPGQLRVDAVLAPLVEAETPARAIGVLETVDVEEGQTVEQGAVLAHLDDRVAQHALRKAELERDQAQAAANNRLRVAYAEKALEVATAELKRSQESIEKFAKSVSQSQLDVERLTIEKIEVERRQALYELELAQFDLKLKQNAVDEARLQCELHQVRAPVTGVVALVRARPGEWVQPGDQVCRIVGVATLRAEGFVLAADAARIRVGDEAVFESTVGSTAVARGVWRYVSPEADPVTGQLRVWAELDNQAATLRPGDHGVLRLP
ncbi:MAG: HlyD family efflux transporter periplasmic adaptor subunit [Planctomycetales bacterium]|nr:HlyD family efflux transporter periplasmic adaptor subunit [Planctomycetales bacterium]